MDIFNNYRYLKNILVIRLREFAVIFKKYINLQRIEDFKRFMAGLDSAQCASISYVPFFGWIYPLAARKGDAFCIHHVKQGFILFAFVTSSLIVLNLINIYSPADWRFFRLGLTILIYSLNIGYFIFCIYSIQALLKKKIIDIRIINKLIGNIKL